ncbi:Hypothetical predicted protein [Octopus vulgaris]|uniref:BED-type domain-containing protein n=1 Tax=Octopus vulgaris TaxID=6645 RepID=A0AA36B8L8_OCTVU|nr:Hypothetical predicted protein [Octopus vulgaris]
MTESQKFVFVDIIEVETASATGPQQEQAQNHWPRLDNYFLIKSREGDKFIFNCKLCLPGTVPIKGHMTNLKLHIKRTHIAKFMQFEEKVKAGSSRGKAKKRFSSGSNSGNSISELSNLFSFPSGKKACQQLIADSFGIAATDSGIPQAAVDQGLWTCS